MLTKISVLDHGFVRLVSYTQPVLPTIGATDVEIYQRRKGWTGDLEIVRNARVSYDADWRAGSESEQDARLIHYLWKNRHTTPFEAISFTFEVKAPIFVFRQWHRHRTWTYNEVSARYTELPDDYYIPDETQVGTQSKSNKQGREEGLLAEIAQDYIRELKASSGEAHETYRYSLRAGIARELARLVLPVNTYSRMFASTDLLNLFRFLELRMHHHAQYEIRVYAQALLTLVEQVVPVAVEAFKENLRE